MKSYKVIFIFVLIGKFCSIAAATKIAVVHWNDMHGHFFPFGQDSASGLPAISTFIKKVKTEYDKVLVLDAGDFNTGQPESDLFQAEPMIVGYNLLRVDACALGNHEFDNPLSVLEKQKSMAHFPFLSANITKKNGSFLATAPYVIKTFENIKVGIFGITTNETQKICLPENIKEIVFSDEIQTAKAIVTELKEKKNCDIIIALVHMGLNANNRSGSRLLASKVSNIDLIIDGHSHTAMKKPFLELSPEAKAVPIVQAHQYGLNVGMGIFTINNSKTPHFEWQVSTINKKNVVKNSNGTTTITPVGPQFDEDPIVRNALIEYIEKTDVILGSKIGVCSTDQWSCQKVRMAETEIGDLVCDSIKWVANHEKPDFAMCSGGSIRADLPQGHLTGKNVFAVLPFDNTVCVCTLRGTEVQQLFNYIASIPPGKGAFPQVSEGVSFTINYNTGKCENILIGGSPLMLNKDYRIATDNYLANGGDDYCVFKKAIKTFDTSRSLRYGCIEYIKQKGPTITPVLHNRMRIVGSMPDIFTNPEPSCEDQ